MHRLQLRESHSQPPIHQRITADTRKSRYKDMDLGSDSVMDMAMEDAYVVLVDCDRFLLHMNKGTMLLVQRPPPLRRV
jgi:hypothetical protein